MQRAYLGWSAQMHTMSTESRAVRREVYVQTKCGMPVRSQQDDKDPTSKGGGGGKITFKKLIILNLDLYVLLEPGFLTWERIFNNEKRLIKKCLSQNSRSLDQIMSCKHNALSTHLSGTAVWGINSHAVSVMQYNHTQTYDIDRWF